MQRLASLFRPQKPIDASVLEEEAALVEAIHRRFVLRGTLSLGALTLLTGCDISNKEAVQSTLRKISGWNDLVQSALFDPKKLAKTYTPAEVRKPPRFNAFYPIDEVKPVDIGSWRLEIGGRVKDKRPLDAASFAGLPEQEIIIRHVCVEGWDYIGQWSGVNFRLFLEKIGADLDAKYIGFRCADGYSASIDMASALHPQTILATKYAGEPITAPFGAPLRLRTAIKLGYKNPKWITALEVTNTYPGGYWEDRGYNWFAGI